MRAFFREYAESLEVDLGFQGFEAELRTLPGAYAPPCGRLLLAWIGDEPVGSAGVRDLGRGACELKRLYVRPSARGAGAGRALAAAAVAAARELGYDRMLLDTLPSMAAARSLYRELGFRPAPAYRFNPVPGTEFLRLDL